MSDPILQVSVLMPAYNVEKYITFAIESVLNQTFKNFELLIIDDGSTDSTFEIIKKYSNLDHRIKISQNRENLGVSKTRNNLIKEARGKYIMWQDADDISLPHRIEEQFSYMETHPDLMIVGGFLQFIDESGKKLSIRSYAESDSQLRKHIFKYSPVSQPVAMIRKEVFEKSGLYDESLNQAEDLDISFRIGKYGKFSNIQKVLLDYRYYPESLSAQKLKENISSTLIVRRKAVSKYGYTMSIGDHLAYIASWGVQFVPPAITQKVFPFLRSCFNN